MVGARILLTAGHVLQTSAQADRGLSIRPGCGIVRPISKNLAAFFFDRVDCFPKKVAFPDDGVLQLEDFEDRDFAVLKTGCHVAFGPPGDAFGRLFVRLWRFCPGQRYTLLGHLHGEPLRVSMGRVNQQESTCVPGKRSDCVRVSSRYGDWAAYHGMSGGPVLDPDGAVLALWKGYFDEWGANGHDHGQVAVPLAVVARVSPDLRKVVRDQAPRAAFVDPFVIADIDATDTDVVAGFTPQLVTVSVPHNAVIVDDFGQPATPLTPITLEGQGHFPSGWSIFYRERRSNHIMHLRTRIDGGERIPDDVMHEDVSVLANLCALGRPGLVHAWYEVPPELTTSKTMYMRRHLLVSERDEGGGSHFCHLIQDGDRRWQKIALGDRGRDLRFASAACTTYESLAWGDGRVGRAAVPQPHAWVVYGEGRDLVFSDWSPSRGWRRLYRTPNVAGRGRVEAIACWHSESRPSDEIGFNVVFTVAESGRPVTIHHIARLRDGWTRPRPIAVAEWEGQVERTLSLSAADSSGGGDVCWHFVTSAGQAEVIMLSIQTLSPLRWNAPDRLTGLDNMPAIHEGKVKMHRGPDWNTQGRYRQNAFVTHDDGQLGHIWWRRQRWHYQRVVIGNGSPDPEASQHAYAPVAPCFLFDGTLGDQYSYGRAPGGCLAFVGSDALIWSVRPSRVGDSFCYGSLRHDDSVTRRCISGASGLPIGWTYDPKEPDPQVAATPLAPGVHSGDTCGGAWEQTRLDCDARVADFGPHRRGSASCASVVGACDFLGPAGLTAGKAETLSHFMPKIVPTGRPTLTVTPPARPARAWEIARPQDDPPLLPERCQTWVPGLGCRALP